MIKHDDDIDKDEELEVRMIIDTLHFIFFKRHVIKMRINTIKVDASHWTSDYIPISYDKVLNKHQLSQSLTFMWNNKFTLNAICRAYYISKHVIEIGDVWLNPDLRGKQINGEKISILFLKHVISKIWTHFPDATTIQLVVHQSNKPAISLYEKCKFLIKKTVNNSKLLFNQPGYKMIRYKR